jgi:hypothetical protein
MRYDEAGQFFIREMELERKYRKIPSPKIMVLRLRLKKITGLKETFPFTGRYYHVSRYGESLWRPTLAGVVIEFLPTLFWLIQSNPTLQPLLPAFQSDDAINNVTSKFVG